MLNRIRHFFGEYKALGFVIVAIAIGLALELTDNHTAARLLLSASAIIATLPLVWGMVQTIRDGGYGLDILAATAIITAIIMREYWAAIVIVLMLTSGEALEDYAESRAQSELKALLDHKPQQAHLLNGTQVKDVAVSTVQTGNTLMVYPGEIIPVDAVILQGSTSVDESSLTGESIPAIKDVGAELLSGSINVEGSITIRALRPEAESQYEQIIKLVRSAASSQSPFVRLADKYSIPFTVVSFLIAGVAWAISGESLRFLQVLVVATPCPLLLGAPIALISGMSRAAKHGIIIKTGAALERLAAVQTVAFDKTGTLTKGKPVVTEVRTYGNYTKDQVLGYAAALEAESRHVLAEAIVVAAQATGHKVRKAKQVKELAGHGLFGRIDGKDVVVGRPGLLDTHDIAMPKDFKLTSLTKTSALVAVGNQLAGVILFEDEVRPETTGMLRQLKKLKIKHVAMVSGDNKTTATAIANKLGIEDVYPECLPRDKIIAVEGMRHRPVAFVGDGVNDAPVLTISEVGIALGARGSTAASESADVVIMTDDVSKVADSIAIAKRTFSIATQSIMIGIVISIALMAIFATGKFKPIYGAAIQELVDVTVILNALRAHGPWGKPKLNVKHTKFQPITK